ncbi:hypothetical protein CA54_12180 [Symmachiella macrocystis]|uniref:Uncharacterized protein n=1 Tax=Symmachiella macrocystis TaxID=2527985 RepID=A0A5C6BP81_9PLAN|nr:hypothetical protein [Symmachiella macrocystis]TWU12394.1 hypothetical protein CA54_12180 [Symmachiella macrocystis]
MVLHSQSSHGCGLRFYGIEPEPDNHVVVTQWLTVLYVPLLPLRRARCLYLGGADAHDEDNSSYQLIVAEKLPLSISSIVSTYLWSFLTLIVAVGPVAYMIHLGFANRAPNPLDSAITLGCTIWMLVVIGFSVFRQWQLLDSALTPERADMIEQQSKEETEHRNAIWRESHVLPESVYWCTAAIGGLGGGVIVDLLGGNKRNLFIKITDFLFVCIFTCTLLASVWSIDRVLIKKRQRNRMDE